MSFIKRPNYARFLENGLQGVIEQWLGGGGLQRRHKTVFRFTRHFDPEWMISSRFAGMAELCTSRPFRLIKKMDALYFKMEAVQGCQP